MRKFFVALLVVSALALLPLPAAAQSDRLMTVVFKSATLPANAQAIVERAGGSVVNAMPEVGVMSITGPASLINTLGRNTAILTISPTLTVKLPETRATATQADPAFDTSTAARYNAYQWDIKQVTKDGASFNLWTGSHATVVGLIDTGVNTHHSALTANILGGRNFVPDGPGGTVVPTDIEDKNGHGSHTAGAVAANGSILGVGPNLGIRSYRVFGAEGGAPNDRIQAAMVAAINDRVDVISMSIGGYDVIALAIWTDPETGQVYKFKDVADFVAYRRIVAYANNHGVLVVAAAGNEGINIGNPANVGAYLNAAYGVDENGNPTGWVFIGAARETPGTLPGVLTVSATGPTMTLASYSNYGPSAIDVTAPGGDFQRYPAMTPTPWYYDMCYNAYMNLDQGTPNWYSWMAGTSMATPKVAAVAALVIDKAKSQGVKLSPAQVIAAVQQSAIDIGKRGVDPFFGFGFASAYTALMK